MLDVLIVQCIFSWHGFTCSIPGIEYVDGSRSTIKVYISINSKGIFIVINFIVVDI